MPLIGEAKVDECLINVASKYRKTETIKKDVERAERPIHHIENPRKAFKAEYINRVT